MNLAMRTQLEHSAEHLGIPEKLGMLVGTWEPYVLRISETQTPVRSIEMEMEQPRGSLQVGNKQKSGRFA